jgi:hypothetical protein
MAVSRLTQTTLQNGFEKYNQLWDGRSAVGSMEAISSITLSAAQASVEFNNIPSTYSHLQLRSIGTTDRSTYALDQFALRFNGDSGNNYSYHYLRGNGSSAVSSGAASNSFIYIESSFSSTAGADIFAATILDILDYTNTNKNTTVRALSGLDINGTINSVGGFVALSSGAWLNTAAITSLFIKSNYDQQIQPYSTFTLYGIK